MRAKMTCFSIAVLVAFLVGIPLGWTQDNAGHNQVIRQYRNVSGSAMTSGTAVIFELHDSNMTTGTRKVGAAQTLGLDVNTTNSLDSRLFAGVLRDDSCADDQTCNFVVGGPALVRWAGSTDNEDAIGTAVGTTGVAGLLGAGTGAGFLLSQNVGGSDAGADASDQELRWVELRPQAP